MKDPVREEIIETAKKMLFTLSEEEITMKMIGEEIGVTAPTLYHYFKGKKEIIVAAYELIKKEITESLFIKFPPSIPAEIKIVTATSFIADYFFKNKLPVSYLIEDPSNKPLDLKEFREKLVDMFSDYFKNIGERKKISAKQMTMRFLAILIADITHIRNSKKDLPKDFAEDVFDVLFDNARIGYYS